MVLNNSNLERYGFLLKDPPTGDAYETISKVMTKLQLGIVANRIGGVKSEEQLIDTMFNNLNLYANIEKLADVYKAAELIVKHIKNNSRIGLVTDYDSDGINSAVTLTKTFLRIFNYPKENVVTIINRRKNGNGMNKVITGEVIAEKERNGLDLIILADHGSSNNDSFKKLKSHGIDIVLTDHHKIPTENYPTNADVVVNNQRLDSTFSKNVSGCCVAFITMLATFEKLYGRKAKDEFNHVLPYVAISTITDMMSLKEPYNRHIVITGLNELNSYRNKGWAGINTVIGIEGKLTYKDIGFKLGPLINTGSRLDTELLVFSTLMAESYKESFELANKLEEFNAYRKEVTKKLVKYYRTNHVDDGRVCHVFIAENMDIDIKGNLATKMGLIVGKPCVCFMLKGDKYNGSTRAILEDVNMYAALTNIKENHEGVISVGETGEAEYGGHFGAAGVTIYKDKLEEFKDLVDMYIKEQLDNMEESTGTVIDAVIPNTSIGPDLAYTLDVCGPYGKDWRQPVLLSQFKIETILVLGSICKIFLRCDDGSVIEGFHFFNTVDEHTPNNIKSMISKGDSVLVAYNLDIEKYSGLYNVGLSILSIKKIGE